MRISNKIITFAKNSKKSMYFKRTDFTPTNSSFYLYDDTDFMVSSLAVSRGGWLPFWINEALKEQFGTNKSTQVLYLHSFGTKVEKRHKGYGRQLLEYVKEFYNGCVVVLEVSSMGQMTNKQLKMFYESVGFEEILPLDGGYPAHYTMVIDLRY